MMPLSMSQLPRRGGLEDRETALAPTLHVLRNGALKASTVTVLDGGTAATRAELDAA